MTPTRRRLDGELVSRGLFKEPQAARKAIEEKRVLVDGAPASTAGTLVAPGSKLTVLGARRYVSRGGEKLEGALSDLKVDPAGQRCLDAGAGSGGFTDCLLQHGAAYVLAVDVGYGQFDWRLRNDSRVRLLERKNIKTLTPADAEGSFGLVVADLSFIGLTNVAGSLTGLTADNGSLLLMVKPQHEAGRADVGQGGVVRDPAVWSKAVERVALKLWELGFGVAGAAPSRLRGAEGNQEFFVLARAGEEPRPSAWQNAVAIAEGRSGEGKGEMWST